MRSHNISYNIRSVGGYSMSISWLTDTDNLHRHLLYARRQRCLQTRAIEDPLLLEMLWPHCSLPRYISHKSRLYMLLVVGEDTNSSMVFVLAVERQLEPANEQRALFFAVALFAVPSPSYHSHDQIPATRRTVSLPLLLPVGNVWGIMISCCGHASI
jgi:hypothetical protein